VHVHSLWSTCLDVVAGLCSCLAPVSDAVQSPTTRKNHYAVMIRIIDHPVELQQLHATSRKWHPPKQSADPLAVWTSHNTL
jgi:hypothetical protein